MRHRTFFSLAEANAAIGEALDRINDHVMRRLGVSRQHLFESVERAALAALPGDAYEFAEWRLVRVGTDDHVAFDAFFYSVPHSLIRQQVDLRATSRTIEIFHRGKRIAAHERRCGGRRHGTDPDHMPSSHRRYADWTPERLRRWGTTIGPVAALSEDVTEILEKVPARLRVIRHVRPKLSCRACATILQAPAPDLPVAKGRPRPGLLVNAVVSKYLDGLPPNRPGYRHRARDPGRLGGSSQGSGDAQHR